MKLTLGWFVGWLGLGWLRNEFVVHWFFVRDRNELLEENLFLVNKKACEWNFRWANIVVKYLV